MKLEAFMDADKFLGSFRDSTALFARAPQFLYAQHHETEGVPCVTIAFKDEPKRHVERFARKDQQMLWWNEYESIMTKMCKPPCVAIREIIFQPAHLHRFVCHTKDQIHFVILDFRNDRTVWMGNHKKEQQIALFVGLTELLRPFLEDQKPLPFSRHYNPPT